MAMRLHERLCYELSHSFYSLDEPPLYKIDVVGSFASTWWRPGVCLLRLALFVWSLQVFHEDLATYPPHNLYIYMGYLTHWGFLLTICYLFCSLLCSLLLRPSDSGGSEYAPEALNDFKHGRLVKNTWALFSLVAPLEICICFLFWSAVTTGGPVTYVSLMEHGVFAIVVLLDGLVVGRIPVRFPQVVLLWTVCFCYLVWTLVDAFYVENGEWGPAYSDDALYPVLNWKQQSRLASIVSSFCLIVLTPGVFWFVWLLSLLSRSGADGLRRHLLVDQGRASTIETDYKQMEHAVLV
ncbi:hypothetical protein MPSEU_000593800 [Mayamaea pseudoterrestris]|nr:hypothetical protein MPSEU_000593800 [Mayamaea pseudoterrestris]